MIHEQSLVLIGVKIPVHMPRKHKSSDYTPDQIHHNQQQTKKKNQGYTSTLKECIKTDDRFQYMDQKLMSHKYLKKKRLKPNLPLTLQSPAMILLAEIG